MADTTTDTTDQQPQQQPQQVEPQQHTDDPADHLGDPGKAALAAERKARREADKTAKELAARLAEYEQRDMTEAQKLAAERDTLAAERDQWRTRAQQTAVANAVTAEAVKLGTVDTDAVVQLLRDRIDVDDDGQPTNVAKAVADLAKSKPYLFRTTPPGARDAHAGNSYALNDADALSRALAGAVGAKL